MYKIGVISDTHGLLRTEVRRELKGCDAIFHGGDIGKPEILDKLLEIAPVFAVRGNVDKEWENLPMTVDVVLAGLKIYMIHNKKMITEDITEKDIVIYGHSHKYEEKRIILSENRSLDERGDGQLWLNPGSCGARRFHLPITMAIIEVDENSFYQIKRIEFSNGTDKDRKGQDDLDIAYAGDRKKLIQSVMKDTNKGIPVEETAKRHGITVELAEQICRLYLTHPGINAEGILNKMM